MRDEVLAAATDHIAALKGLYPDVDVELLDEQTYSADVWVRIRCATRDQVDEVMETVGHLTAKFYVDRGVYIQGSASATVGGNVAS